MTAAPDHRWFVSPPQRLVSVGSRVLRLTGLDGAPGSQRMFLRFAFFVRLALVGSIPLFFLAPEPAYRPTPRRVATCFALIAWTFVVFLIERESRPRRWRLVTLADLAVAFAAFGAIASSSLAAATSRHAYIDVLTGGAFHLQTYAPLVTAGAILGAARAVQASLIAVGMYFGSLWLAGAPAH